MSWTGARLRELQEALTHAFPNRGALERMLLFRMDVRLSLIAGTGSLSDVAFEVIRWAEAQGRLEALVRAAHAENPGSPRLREFDAQLGAEGSPSSSARAVGEPRIGVGGDVRDSVLIAGSGNVVTTSAGSPDPSVPTPADFLIISPMEEERDAVLAKLPGFRRHRPTAHDVRVYFTADVPYTYDDGAGGRYRVALCPLLGMGRVEAAHATGDAIRYWRPRYVLLVGIAGGVAGAGVSLGDVLVSNQIADYELQKLYADHAAIRWQVHRVDPRLLGAAQNLLGNEWMQLIQESRPDAGVPKRHLGTICTGDKVIARELPPDYLETWAKLIGVEMEAGGVAGAAFQSAYAPGFFMIRGVSDLADVDKDTAGVKDWRAYACDVAAAYTMALIQSGPIPPADFG